MNEQTRPEKRMTMRDKGNFFLFIFSFFYGRARDGPVEGRMKVLSWPMSHSPQASDLPSKHALWMVRLHQAHRSDTVEPMICSQQKAMKEKRKKEKRRGSFKVRRYWMKEKITRILF